MIFYFSGTGNSLFAAKRLLSDGETLINIADAVKNQKYTYTVPDDESVGFVFPVYFYTVPEIIRQFVSGLTLDGAEYVYAVITCGGGISQAGAVLKKLLAQRNNVLHFVSSLLMPDNSMLFYQIPPTAEGVQRLQDAEDKLVQLKAAINHRTDSTIGSSTILSDLVGLGYRLCSKTAKFYADEKCTGCGLCAENCPTAVIEINSGKPEWTKPKCLKCSACINRCPTQAIQYGKATKRRNRYVNPEV